MNDAEDNDVKKLLQKAKKAFVNEERTNAESTWAEIAEFILPNQGGRFFDNTAKGIKRDQRVFDSSALVYCRDLANSLHSTITNPAAEWSKLRFRSDEFNNDRDGMDWLQHATKVFHTTINDSNFDIQVGEGYQSYCGLGVMAIFHDEKMEHGKFAGFNFIAWNLAEIAYCENEFGLVDTCYRKFNMKLNQLVSMFPDTIPDDIKDQAQNTPLKEMLVYHCIYPRDTKYVELNDVKLGNAKKRPFASHYILEKGCVPLKEDGYYEFPVYIPRWSKLPGEVYPFGPGHVARADCRTLNKLKEEDLKSVALATRPPYITTQNNVISADLRPAHETVVRNMDEFKQYETKARFEVTENKILQLQNSLKSVFYIDKLMLPPRTETGEMTAYEIQQRLSQMQVVLGPVLSRLNFEFLSQLVSRSIRILQRNRRINPIPESIKAKLKAAGQESIDYDVLFVNSLARSQQLEELRNVQTFMQETLQMAQLNPGVLDKLDFDAMLDYSASIRNIPEKFVKSTEDVKALRDARAQQQQLAQGLQVGESLGNIVKNVGSGMPQGE